METNQSALKRHLSLFGVSVFGVGVIVGAGIYSVIGVAYGHARETIWLSFLLAGFAAFLTGVSYCEVATMYPSAGAEYTYLRKSFPRTLFPSFMIAMILIIGGAVTATAVAYSFAGYLQYYFHFNQTLAAGILIVLCTLINLRGIQSSNRANLLFTFLEIMGIVLVLWFGFTEKNPVHSLSVNVHSGTLTAVGLIFFVYLGFEDIANLSEETKEPEKNIPKAILYSLAFTTALYLLISFAVMRLVESETLANSQFPLAEVLKDKSLTGSRILSVIALFSTANTALITMLVTSRMLFSVARSGDLPAVFGKTKGRTQAPSAATLLTMILTLAFLSAANLEDLVSLSSLATLAAFAAVNLSVIRLRSLESETPRPFRVPLTIGKWPLPSLAGLLLTIVMCFGFNKKIYLIFSAVILVCGVIFFFRKKKSANL